MGAVRVTPFQQKVCVSSVSMQRCRGMKGIGRKPMHAILTQDQIPTAMPSPPPAPPKAGGPMEMGKMPWSLQSWDGGSQIPGAPGVQLGTALSYSLPIHLSQTPLVNCWLLLWLYY